MSKIVYLSPTGNTELLADALAKHFNTTAIPLEEYHHESADHIVFMYPVHGFNPPRTFKRFINQLPVGSSKISLLAVGVTTSWINHSVSSTLKRKLRKKGYMIMVDTVIPMPLTIVLDMKVDAKKTMIENGYKMIKDIALKIQEDTVVHLHPKIHSRVIKQVGKAEDFASRLFGLELHANKNCTKCGICIKGCPEKNIKFSKKNKLKFGFSCMMCMKCIYNCPERAISPYISKFLVIKEGYNIKNIAE